MGKFLFLIFASIIIALFVGCCKGFDSTDYQRGKVDGSMSTFGAFIIIVFIMMFYQMSLGYQIVPIK